MNTENDCTKGVKLLFIGNSHTYYNDMAKIVADLLNVVGINAEVFIMTEGGKGLIYHCDRFDVRFNILYGNFDFVVLQDKATNFNPAEYANGVDKINTYIRQTGATGVYYMMWSNREKPEEQAEMAAKCVEIAKEHDGLVAPVGVVWKDILSSREGINLYRDDGNHATVCGSYLVASTIFYTVTGRKSPLSSKDRGTIENNLRLNSDDCNKIHEISCLRAAEYNS